MFNIPIYRIFTWINFDLIRIPQWMVIDHCSLIVYSGDSFNARFCKCATVIFLPTVYRTTYLLLSQKKIKDATTIHIYIANTTRKGHDKVRIAKYYDKINSKFFSPLLNWWNGKIHNHKTYDGCFFEHQSIWFFKCKYFFSRLLNCWNIGHFYLCLPSVPMVNLCSSHSINISVTRSNFEENRKLGYIIIRYDDGKYWNIQQKKGNKTKIYVCGGRLAFLLIHGQFGIACNVLYECVLSILTFEFLYWVGNN